MRGVGNEPALRLHQLRDPAKQAIDGQHERTDLHGQMDVQNRMHLMLGALVNFKGKMGDRPKHLAHQIDGDQQQDRNQDQERQQCAKGASGATQSRTPVSCATAIRRPLDMVLTSTRKSSPPASSVCRPSRKVSGNGSHAPASPSTADFQHHRQAAGRSRGSLRPPALIVRRASWGAKTNCCRSKRAATWRRVWYVLLMGLFERRDRKRICRQRWRRAQSSASRRRTA